MDVNPDGTEMPFADGCEIRSVLLIAWPLLPKSKCGTDRTCSKHASCAGCTGWYRMCGLCICHSLSDVFIRNAVIALLLRAVTSLSSDYDLISLSFVAVPCNIVGSFMKFLHAYWREEDVDPEAFHTTLMTMLLKKGDPPDPNKWRGIPLLSVASKLVSSVIATS